jgi:hypothetical protein
MLFCLGAWPSLPFCTALCYGVWKSSDPGQMLVNIRDHSSQHVEKRDCEGKSEIRVLIYSNYMR